MDRALIALARERYRPGRWSALGPSAIAAAGAERLARDVSLRWEEAAEAFLEAIRALERRGGSGRTVEAVLETGRDDPAGPAGVEGAGGSSPGEELRGPEPPWRHEMEEYVPEGAFLPRAEDRPPPGERGWRHAREPVDFAGGGPSGEPPPGPGAPGEGEGIDLDADPGREPIARSTTGHRRLAAHDGERRSAGGIPRAGTPSLPRPRAARASAARSTLDGRMPRAAAAAGPANGNATPPGPGPAPAPRRRPPSADRSAPGPSRAAGAFAVAPPDEADRAPAAGGLDRLALERLLDERMRREAALEEWKRTEF